MYPAAAEYSLFLSLRNSSSFAALKSTPLCTPLPSFSYYCYDFSQQQLNMNSLILASPSNTGIELIKDRCESIQRELERVQQSIKLATDEMNSLLLAGHVDYKDQFKPKSQHIIDLSKQIQEYSRQMQKIYDNKAYIQFCLLLEEQMRYKEFNQTELQEGANKLATVLTQPKNEDL